MSNTVVVSICVVIAVVAIAWVISIRLASEKDRPLRLAVRFRDWLSADLQFGSSREQNNEETGKPPDTDQPKDRST